jgi:hypothetical protein
MPSTLNTVILALCSVLFASCATTPKRDATFKYSSDRSLEYTDALVASNGLIYVKYGSILAGQYPSEEEKADISYIENLLQAKGFTPTKTKESATYALSVSSPSSATSPLWHRYTANLTRYIRNPSEIIKYHGYTDINMWRGEVILLLDETTDNNIYKRQVFRRLVSMIPSRTERSDAPITEL